MNVSYIDFWPGFDINCNWFNLLLKSTFPDRTFNFQSIPEKADIILFSCFGQEHKKYKDSKAVKILYIGENQRPDYSIADYSLSFDFDNYKGKNFRLPHWFLYINWWNEPDFPHAKISLNDLTKINDSEEIYNRKYFCSIMIGNPVQNRINTAAQLNEFKPVHGYGKVFNNPVEDKIKTLEKYRWNICFENSIYDGYVTEKLLEAKVAGCIPLYYGSSASKIDFNEKAFIDVTNFSLEEIYNTVLDIENNKNKFLNIVSEPIFNKIPTLNELSKFLQNSIRG